MSSAFLYLCFLLLQALSFSLPASPRHLSPSLSLLSLCQSATICLLFVGLITLSRPTSSVQGLIWHPRLQRAEGHVATSRSERWQGLTWNQKETAGSNTLLQTRPLAHKQEKPSREYFPEVHHIPPSQILPTVHKIDMAAFIHKYFATNSCFKNLCMYF